MFFSRKYVIKIFYKDTNDDDNNNIDNVPSLIWFIIFFFNYYNFKHLTINIVGIFIYYMVQHQMKSICSNHVVIIIIIIIRIIINLLT